jgi:carboxylesterase
MKLNPETGIQEGAEPLFLKGKNSKAVLLLHGYIGSPTDFGFLPGKLHEKGYTVSIPLLPGHGRDPRTFSKTTAEEMLNFTKAEYEKLKQTHEEVIVIGFSMGGALATLLTKQYSIGKLILLAPYYEIAHQWYYIFPTEVYSRAFTPYIPYLYRPRSFKQINDRTFLHKIIDYDFISTRGSEAAIELSRQAKAAAPEIKSKTLVIHSKKDKATSYQAAKQLSEKMMNAKFISLQKSNHMLLWDYEREVVEKEIFEFLKWKESNQ